MLYSMWCVGVQSVHQDFKQHIIDKLWDYRVTIELPLNYQCIAFFLFLNDTIIQVDILILDCYHNYVEEIMQYIIK